MRPPFSFEKGVGGKKHPPPDSGTTRSPEEREAAQGHSGPTHLHSHRGRWSPPEPAGALCVARAGVGAMGAVEGCAEGVPQGPETSLEKSQKLQNYIPLSPPSGRWNFLPGPHSLSRASLQPSPLSAPFPCRSVVALWLQLPPLASRGLPLAFSPTPLTRGPCRSHPVVPIAPSPGFSYTLSAHHVKEEPSKEPCSH